jgi:ParB-like chromosome segregation protein Spo0J
MATTIKVHPAAEAYRLMTDEELASLAADMAANGQRDPIVLGRVNGEASEKLIDGRNRLRACELAGIEPQFETRQFESDDEVRAFVKSRGERRNISKGEQAMAVAWLYPEPERGRGKKDAARKETETISFSRIKQARQVRRYSIELAAKVRDGIVKLDKAMEQVEAARKELQSAETQIVRLRAEAPDLADQVDEERLTLSEAFAAFEQRKHDAEEKEKNRREVAIRITEGAYRDMVSWGNDEFVANMHVLIAEPEFRRALIERTRIDPQFLPNIQRGGAALFKLLSSLMEKSHGS